MRILELMIMGLGGMVLAPSAEVPLPTPQGVAPTEMAGEDASLDPAEAPGIAGQAQEAPPVAELLRAARLAEPLACALMMRTFDFGFWSGERGALVHVPGDPVASVRQDYDRLMQQRPDPESAPLLIEALASDDDCEQRISAALLGRIKDADVRTQIRRAMRSGPERARIGAVLAVGYADDHEALSQLEQVLAGQGRDLRLAALWALGRIESSDALPAIEASVSDSDALVRQNALWALGQIESAGSVATVTGALSDSDAAVRLNAAWALGQIESSAAIPALVDRLALDPDPRVRQMIAWALGQIE